ncbi:MAG: hypothetical protein NW206_02860 [Hyphomonadaceae bacterium]|nr:hypothetical protein [Hyphomonadaceae bacterium]
MSVVGDTAPYRADRDKSHTLSDQAGEGQIDELQCPSEEQVNNWETSVYVGEAMVQAGAAAFLLGAGGATRAPQFRGLVAHGRSMMIVGAVYSNYGQAQLMLNGHQQTAANAVASSRLANMISPGGSPANVFTAAAIGAALDAGQDLSNTSLNSCP